MSSSRTGFVPNTAPHLCSYPRYWAECFGPAPYLPTSREEMDRLGWDSCDVIIVTGDAYVDHPSFGMAVIGRTLEAQGFRVGIIDQPDWQSAEPFKALGQPNLYFGITAGNMDSMINRYTAERRRRSDDAYSPDNQGDRRPDRATLVYSHRCREAYSDVPIVIGGIEASLRRIAHYDYWSDKVRRSVLIDAKADMLLYGNAERALVELTHRLSRGEPIARIQDIRGTVYLTNALPPTELNSVGEPWAEIGSTSLDTPGTVDLLPNPYEVDGSIDTAKTGPAAVATQPATDESSASPNQSRVVQFQPRTLAGVARERSVIRLPSYDAVRKDPALYAHSSRILHAETNPGNARALVQAHGSRDIWLNPPPLPLTTDEMDSVFDLPYARLPHPKYEGRKIPAWEMIRYSVNIMRGCFGGCTFCSITEHEGRIIQSRSETSILNEIEQIRDKTPGFTGVISDLGGPTANMYRLACKDPKIEAACRRPACVYPDICSNLNTDHAPLVELYRKAREIPGIKKILIASGVRYDLAVESPEYVEELVTHHVGGYLKIAPEHTEEGPLSLMMKPGIGTYNRFKTLFDRFSKKAGKEQYLIPYFIAAHPGTTDLDMVNLALWLKANGYRADQVQNFYPSPMATATAMYHSGKNPLSRIKRDDAEIPVAKGGRQRRLHKALLRYHDPDNWPIIRQSLKDLGLANLIGYSKQSLVPPNQPGTPRVTGPRKPAGNRAFQTRHTAADRPSRPAPKRSDRPPGKKRKPPRTRKGTR
ncbi:MAG: YgiQ family radical SAM protein [Gammaproteobacteria bacterium]|nr:YgiQ family radical SAM protein [Gammaproteobacteria bacterium]